MTMGNIQIADIRTIGVPVADQDRALDFYIGTLGFEKRLDAPIPGGGRWVEVGPAGGSTTVALITAHDGLPAGVETGIRFVTSNAEADHAYLQERGVDTGDLLRWPGVPPMFAFHDADGNGLEIVEQS
jgi:lactoylglutathione lyase